MWCDVIIANRQNKILNKTQTILIANKNIIDRQNIDLIFEKIHTQ